MMWFIIMKVMPFNLLKLVAILARRNVTFFSDLNYIFSNKLAIWTFYRFFLHIVTLAIKYSLKHSSLYIAIDIYISIYRAV